MKNRSVWIAVGTLLTVSLATPRSAAASQISYTSLATFQAAAGALTTENFNSTATGNLSTGGAYSTPFTAFTLSGNGNGDFVSVTNGANIGNINGTNFLYASQRDPVSGAYSGDGNAGPSFTFTFSQAMKAFAFDWTDTDGTDEYFVTINGVTYQNPPFNSGGTGSGFFGVVLGGGETFTTVVFSHDAAFGGIVDPFGLDNVQFSQAAAVPEPGSMLLLGSGLAAMVLGYRRRRTN